MERASDVAYRELKSWIQTAAIAPGDLIDEDDAARQLGISRTPVREALLRLQSEGFVEIARGKGIRVLPLSSDDMREIYQVISGLEMMAVVLVADRRRSRAELAPMSAAVDAMRAAFDKGDTNRWGDADENFHRELMRLSGNGKLYAIGCQLRDLAKRAHMVAVRLQPEAYKATSMHNHAELVSSFLGKGPQSAWERHFEQRRRGEDALVGIVEKYKLKNL